MDRIKIVGFWTSSSGILVMNEIGEEGDSLTLIQGVSMNFQSFLESGLCVDCSITLHLFLGFS